MKTYKIPITWQSYKTYEVRANSLQDATTNAVKKFLSEPDDHYLDDSFEIDEIVYDDYEGEPLDMRKVMSSL